MALPDLLDATRQRLSADRLLITEVTADRQYVIAQAGLPLPATYAVHMPLTHSICQHAIGMRFPLSIENTHSHPLLVGSEAIVELVIGAYLGVPFGPRFPAYCMCALALTPRPWQPEHRYLLSETITAAITLHLPELDQRVEAIHNEAS
ncbi:hypothetical protein [Sagittula salina]|uniref:GAF domain-containing protein n=1 Tax=Sagittula salina TaxID=2820268 RepID=A0A940S127_9RHOB|nr:hypothetical protein [Sagittula salina]MBP0482691.1 hypothetical protein [Sagittula salina]